MPSLIWMQTAGCSGDTMAILCAENPSLHDTLTNYGVDLLWHPSLSTATPRELEATIERICAGEQELTVLCVEGAIALGPDGTGMFDSMFGEAKMDIIKRLANHAQFVIAMGTCAAFGGVSAAGCNPTDSVGMQFRQSDPGGLLDPSWRSAGGLPVINVAGCPAHPSSMVRTLVAALLGAPVELDPLNRPAEFFSTTVHRGCTRNEYHEYNVEEKAFGGDGCLFINLGCQGPTTQAICNTELWNGESSKTRAGAPCIGCTAPNFPKAQNLLVTLKVGPIPMSLPLGVKRAKYMAYKGLARDAAPERLQPTAPQAKTAAPATAEEVENG